MHLPYKLRRVFVHLAYLDDSDTRAKKHKWQVMSAVLIEDKSFKLAETGVSIIPEMLIPSEKLDQFEEFHACELYGGYGVFEGVEQSTRFEAIERLLAVVHMLGLPIMYGAVNLARLQQEFYASADPLDISFRICLKGILELMDAHIQQRVQSAVGEKIENYALEHITPHVVTGLLEELVILIMDECDKKTKETLHRSFRDLRPPRRATCQINHLHDDMYFGDSRFSIGIQLADLCSYLIARHLDEDAEIEGFYKMIEPHIAFSEIHPPLPIPMIGKQDTSKLEVLRKIGGPGEMSDGE